MPSRPPEALVLSDEQRESLASLSKSQTKSVRLVLRARVLLLASTGLGNSELTVVPPINRAASRRVIEFMLKRRINLRS